MPFWTYFNNTCSHSSFLSVPNLQTLAFLNQGKFVFSIGCLFYISAQQKYNPQTCFTLLPHFITKK